MLMPISPRSAYSLVSPILGHLGKPTFQSSRSVTFGQLLSVGVPSTLDRSIDRVKTQVRFEGR